MKSQAQASLWIAFVIIPTLTLAQEVEPAGSQGQWGPWTSWSVCSQTCGSGLAYRVRHCHRSAGGSGQCAGQDKQHQVCNREECPGGQDDYRSVECRKFGRHHYGGRRYQWEAFINPYARCELACKARNHRYYARFRKTAQDGTPCKHDTDAICLAGECLDVGCDGILGSGAVVDQCGICGGDGSTCRVISGIFTRTHLRPYGYHHVTTLPVGACNVNITELARSRNYLALLTSDGANIVNGERQLRGVGQYRGAGTTFDYRRRSGVWCPGACIFADGPLTQAVDVQLLYYDRNPGIMYHFTVPQHTAKAVMTAANATYPHHPHSHPHHHDAHDDSSAADQNPAAGREGAPHRGDPAKPAKRRGNRTRDSSSPSSSSQRNRDKKSNGRSASLTEFSSEGVSSDSTSSPSLRDSPPPPPPPPSSPRERLSSRRRHRRPSAPRGPSRQHSPSVSQGSSSVRREELSPGGRQRRPSSPQNPGQGAPGGQGESPFQAGPSSLPNVASAPHYVPPEGDGAPIEYRHYYHVDSDHFRRHSQRGAAGFAALNSGARRQHWNKLAGGAGAEALSRPNLIPATRHTRRRWGSGSDVISNDVNAVGDVPLAVPASGYFVWTISGFTSCSRPCGGGTQQTVVVCMKSDTRVVVMAENCDVNARPSPTTVQCNTQPCDPQWTQEDWSACSVTCGHGVQSRRVECKQRISPTLHLSVSADRCPNSKPPVTQFCRRPPCFQWRASNWTTCSTDCGLGERTRRAWCVNGEGEEVAAARCAQEPPRTRILCDMGSCAKGWYYSKWSKECKPECGAKTYKTRQVHCAAEDGGRLSADKCPADQRPRTRKSCGVAAPCGGKWFAGPWSQCNSTCGDAWRTREVVCMKKHGRRLWGVVDKENCLRKERPHAREPCSNLLPCEPEWYMTHWTQCSKTCGTGIKTREVKCLNVSMQPSLSCNAKRRPQERRPCNKHSCDGSNDTSASHRQSNDYDPRPRKVGPPQRYQESTSPNTTYQHYRHNHTRQPMALQASAPARISLQQDVRSALGDDVQELSHQHQRLRHHAHHHRHQAVPSVHTSQPSADLNSPEQTTDSSSLSSLTTTSTTRTADQQTAPTMQAVNPQCTDKPSGRWCLFVSQARLCGYRHYQKRCCHTCSKYALHH